MWIIPIEDLIVHGSLRAQPCMTFIPANQNNHPGPFLFIRSNPYSRSMSRRQSKLSRHMLKDDRVESHHVHPDDPTVYFPLRLVTLVDEQCHQLQIQ